MRRRQHRSTRERLQEEAQERGNVSNRIGRERRKLDLKREDREANGTPSYWGTGPTIFHGCYLETDPNKGGLEYPDAVKIVPVIMPAYEVSKFQHLGQHVLVKDALFKDIYVELAIINDAVQLRLPALNTSSKEKTIYGKTSDPSIIIDYKPALEDKISSFYHSGRDSKPRHPDPLFEKFAVSSRSYGYQRF
jgi:hypothetical protein